jgi:hypothetical protein
VSFESIETVIIAFAMIVGGFLYQSMLLWEMMKNVLGYVLNQFELSSWHLQ